MMRTFAPSPIARALLVAGVIMAASASLAYASPEYISTALAGRLFGTMLGAVVVFYANVVPKSLIPLARMRCDPATEQALRRFAGQALVLGGLGYAAASLLAPLGMARYLAIAALSSALLAVAIRYRLALGSGGTCPVDKEEG